MSGITDRELEELRVEQEKYLDKLVTQRRPTNLGDLEADPQGQVTLHVPCSIKAGFGFFRNVADKFQVTNPHVIRFKRDQDLKVGDKLTTEDIFEAKFEIRDITDADSLRTMKTALADRIG